MTRSAPAGITPPTPGLDREEPEFRREDDIPADDGGPAAKSERGSASHEENRERHKPERE